MHVCMILYSEENNYYENQPLAITVVFSRLGYLFRVDGF